MHILTEIVRPSKPVLNVGTCQFSTECRSHCLKYTLPLESTGERTSSGCLLRLRLLLSRDSCLVIYIVSTDFRTVWCLCPRIAFSPDSKVCSTAWRSRTPRKRHCGRALAFWFLGAPHMSTLWGEALLKQSSFSYKQMTTTLSGTNTNELQLQPCKHQVRFAFVLRALLAMVRNFANVVCLHFTGSRTSL